MPETRSAIRPLPVILLVVAVVFVAIAIYFFVSIYPKRGALFVALAVASLVGAWFSNRRAG
jgi:hypothetical protein